MIVSCFLRFVFREDYLGTLDLYTIISWCRLMWIVNFEIGTYKLHALTFMVLLCLCAAVGKSAANRFALHGWTDAMEDLTPVSSFITCGYYV